LAHVIQGRDRGELAGIAPAGRRVHQPGITILRFEGPAVVERHSVADFATVVDQLTRD